MMKVKELSWKQWLTGLLLVLLLVIVTGYIFLKMNTYEAMSEATAMLEDETVTQESDWLAVTPENVEGHIVFYQGGLVESAAYLPLAKSLSEEGYQVFIPQMPLELAILDTDAIEDIKEANPSEKEWWLAGHSLGGASAAIYAEENAEELAGLIFLAAYPGEGNDLSGSNLPVLSITGSQDGIMNPEQYEQTKALLPEHTSYAEIEGGNHSNFGYYGYQDGDGASTLSRKEQLDETIQLILDFINQ